MAPGLVFATVGSTKFDSLVYNITQEDVLKALKVKGFNRLNIQIGCGTRLPNLSNGEKTGVKITYYRYKDSIDSDIMDADFVIGHAGAGTCLEVLDKRKPLLVVINEELMDNHQCELAHKLSSDGYLYSCNISDMCETVQKIDLGSLKKFPKGDPNLFPTFLNKFMKIIE